MIPDNDWKNENEIEITSLISELNKNENSKDSEDGNITGL
jgi:hypothetical protein